MRNIKLYRLALVNREKESKELWTVVRRNPAFWSLACTVWGFLLTSEFGPCWTRVQH